MTNSKVNIILSTGHILKSSILTLFRAETVQCFNYKKLSKGTTRQINNRLALSNCVFWKEGFKGSESNMRHIN